jgi:hypothetical protein
MAKDDWTIFTLKWNNLNITYSYYNWTWRTDEVLNFDLTKEIKITEERGPKWGLYWFDILYKGKTEWFDRHQCDILDKLNELLTWRKNYKKKVTQC